MGDRWGHGFEMGAPAPWPSIGAASSYRALVIAALGNACFVFCLHICSKRLFRFFQLHICHFVGFADIGGERDWIDSFVLVCKDYSISYLVRYDLVVTTLALHIDEVTYTSIPVSILGCLTARGYYLGI